MQSGKPSVFPDVALRPAIPGLIVADRVQPLSELPDPRAPDVEVCHNARGDLLAYCRGQNGALRVDLPDLASFSYERGARHVRAIPHRPLSAEFILDTYQSKTGDRPTGSLLVYYKRHHALVRAKIAVWHLKDRDVLDPAKWIGKAKDYLCRAASLEELHN